MMGKTKEEIIRGTPLEQSSIVYQFQMKSMLLLNVWHDITNQEMLDAVRAKPDQYALRTMVSTDDLLRAPAATIASVRADMVDIGCAQREDECESEAAAPAAGQAGLAKELHTKFVAIITGATSLGENRVYDLADALVKEAAPVAADTELATSELIDLLRAIRPNYGAVGSRDVDVTAQQQRIDRAIELLATPADAGAGLDERELFEKSEPDANLERDGDYYVNPCTQSAWDGWKARAKLAGQSPAPVTAEPAATINTPEFRELLGEHLDANGIAAGLKARAALISYIDSTKLTIPAPADRDAIRDQALEEAAKVCDEENDDCPHPAPRRCADAIRGLKTKPTAFPKQTGGQEGGEHG